MPTSPAESTPYRLLITAGPTHEPIDAVRYVGNRSSGRLGIGLASAAVRRGITTTLLLGPTALAPPEGTSLIVDRFRTTGDLGRALDRLWPTHDVLIMAAAVADYRPVDPAAEGDKLPRGRGRLTLELEPTEDLLARLAANSRPDQTLIGFALEPASRLAASAGRKLREKGVDAIVANPLETMDAEAITATVLTARGETLVAPPDLAKTAFAEWLLDLVPVIREPARSRGNAP